MAHPYDYAAALPAEGAIHLDQVLPGTSPCDLEVGFGRADFLLERARAQPGRRLLGLELRLKWAAIAQEKLRSRGLDHARAYAADARRVLPRFAGEGIFSTVFVHFPDPWWKRRHEKRLVVAADMLEHYRRLLAPGGHLFVQTDVLERAELYRDLLAGAEGFRNVDPAGGFLKDNPFEVLSHRERKCAQAGLPVYRLLVERR